MKKADKPKQPELALIPNEDFWSVMVCACRYCLGRRSYMPSTVTEWIMDNCEGHITRRAITVMLHDVHESRERNDLGDPCDANTWERFEQWLNEQWDNAPG